ncbi:pentatricopeptide repeat-containing protein At4g21065-like [Alnus glutinosa]|uniref:pentatricopeptide repeat-containing protein At4g21065-like n=1 Tax=Alnus glutinosa TaxID=3517 RepID=UPI002D7742E1|nr:pentatricopeptide repeat-containing protein At4g21065-like [Alnus glutinosa]XP_062143762.1 pentatricopeptide repeat-containing protein At4g21065-like [Alnus glutinosa]
MRWTSLSLCFGSTAFSKPPHFFSLVSLTTSRRFQSYWRHSSPYHYSTNESAVGVLHAKAVKSGTFQILNVGNHILNLCVKSQDLDYAQKLFDEISDRDVRTWTILMSGYARIGASRMVLDLFKDMQIEGVRANQFTLSSVLKCCSSVSDLRMGKGIHGWILRNGIKLDVILENSVLDFYVKCGTLDYAEKLFELMVEKDTVSWNIMVGANLLVGDMEKSLDMFRGLPYKDVASWNTIIDGLTRNGYERTALELLYEMVKNGPAFNKITFSIALVLVSSLYTMDLGRQIHGHILRSGFQKDGFVRTSLIDMYCKWGKMEKASIIFRKMPLPCVREKNSKFTSDELTTEIVSWSSMVSGYVRNGEYEDALKMFISMVRDQVEVDRFTVTSIISACADAGILELGRQIHAYVQKVGHTIDLHFSSSSIDMYAKCGCLDDAWTAFKQTVNLNVVSWTSMIIACALHGKGRKAVWLFEQMMHKGIKPNEVAFVGVLSACSHAGLLEEGYKYFRLMKEVHCIKPGVEHFTCMVDLYGRAGHLDKAKEFIHENGISHLTAVWKSFLSSCRLHKNIEMGKWVSETLLQLEPLDSGPYILFSNMCATSERWEEAAKMRSLMQQRRINKVPGQSWIQLKNQVHTFVMGNRSHPQDTEIYTYLDELIGRLKEIGYTSDVTLVMQDVEEEQREVLLGYHSEKLAVVYGIISTTSEMPIRVMKNLRVCTDCHNFIKYTSGLLHREIIVRDIHRFHHFKHGHCSCGDYW